MLDNSAGFALCITENKPVSLKENSTVSIFKDSGTLAAMLYLVRSIILICENKIDKLNCLQWQGNSC